MRLSSTLLLFGLLCTTPALADRPHGDERRARPPPDHSPRLLMAQSDGPSLGEAVERVRRQYNGRIVSAETHVIGNREVHFIKVLTEDGKVKTVRISGRTRSPR